MYTGFFLEDGGGGGSFSYAEFVITLSILAEYLAIHSIF